MKTCFILFGFFLLPFLSAAQVVDTAMAQKQVDSLIQISRTHTGNREYDKALSLNALAEQIALDKLGRESAAYGSCCFNRGRVNYIKVDYPEAEKWYLESKAIREKALGNAHPDYAWSLSSLASLYRLMGNYEKAEPLYLESKAIREKALGEEHLDYAGSLTGLGHLYSDMGNYEKAEPFYLEAKVIRKKVLGKENPNFANSLNDLALLYSDMGNYEKAEPIYIESLAIKQKALGKEHPDYAGSLYNLANLYLHMGNYEKAEQLYLEVKAIWEKVLGKEHPDYALSLSSLADLYSDLDNYGKAELLYFEAKSIREKVLGKEHPNYATSLNNLANLYLKMDNYKKAEPLYIEAKSIREKVLGKEHPNYASSLNNLANLYKELGNYKKAEPLYLEAKAIWEKVLGKEHPNYAASLNNLAILYRNLNQLNQSEQYFTEVSSIIKRILQKSATYLPSHGLEKHIALYHDNNDAFYAFNHQTASDTFRIASYNNALFYKGFALETATRLEQAMQSAPDSIRDLHSRWKGYNRLLAAELAKPIAERKHAVYLDSMSNVLEKVLLRAAPAFAETQRQVEWQDVEKALQSDEAAIEFIHYRYSDKKTTDSTMYSVLVTMPGAAAPQFIPLCEARQLDALVYKPNGTRANYLQNLYASPTADGLASLHQLIWSPIENLLRENGVKTVYYSPTGLLHRLNLSAIAEGKSGTRLAERHHLVPMGSTRLLAERMKEGLLAEGTKARQLATDRSEASPSKLNDALIYGGIRYEMDSSAISVANTKQNATAQDTTGGLFGFSRLSEHDRGEWDYLPGTEKEARYLDGLLRRRGVNTTLRLGYDATEESFKQIGQNGPSPSLLHIGTHGFFFPDPQDTSRRRAALSGDEPVFKISEYSMIRSGLKLAGSKYAWEHGHPLPGGYEDGILTAYEVSQMNLSNTQLVVLSACETGLGDIRGNEGVYGLQRAFRIAGAKNVLMSLWKVPDDATEKLMTRFYNNWLVEKKPLRASFSEAQKWLRGQKGYENPYFWAGFVLVGEL